MARIDSSGIDELVKDMQGYADDINELSERSLSDSAEIMEFNWVNEIQRRGHVDSQDMVRSVERRPTRKFRTGSRYVDVYPQGTDHKGVRNAEKAFILHYGAPKRNITPSGFVSEIEKKSADEIDRNNKAIHEAILRRRGL